MSLLCSGQNLTRCDLVTVHTVPCTLLVNAMGAVSN